MIRRFTGMLIAFMLAISIAAFAFARGAPTKKAFASNAAIVSVTPIVANVPTMTGYDVVQNITKESRDLSIAQHSLKVDTSTATRLSSTGGPWRSINAEMTGLPTVRPEPAIVLLA